MKNNYCSFCETSLIFDFDKSSFKVCFEGKAVLSDCHFLKNGERVAFTESKNYYSIDATGMDLKNDTDEMLIILRDGKLSISVSCPMTLVGYPVGEDFIATSRGEHKFFRASYGPASSALDDTLFDRARDFGITVDCEGKKFLYDFSQNAWVLCAKVCDINNRITVSFVKDIYKSRYGVNYSPINKKSTFDKPPVGWMTWYAVKFNACEKAVLDNAEWMSKNLKKFGADSVWVDWEWYHRDMKGVRDDGCDIFNPDKDKYPNGLKYVSDKIRDLGLIPCLWMGVCTDPGENNFVKEHPEAVLVHKPVWCGQYFFDFTHPEFLNNFLPRALGQVDEWGYEAVKMDTLPNGYVFNEENRLSAYNPDISTREAYRNMIAKCREILGDDRYLLSCSGISDMVILWPADMFEAVRIGDDVFAWDSFVNGAVGRAARYYPFHNVMFYNDADNVIVREEFNTFEQAKSRSAFVGLLGLPVTLGDNLPELPEERVELLRRSIPSLDIHSSQINRFNIDKVVTTCLSVQKEFGAYNVVSVFNTTDTETETEVSLSDLGIDCKNALIWEFYSLSFEKGDLIKAHLKPYETRVYAVHDNTGFPQIISTSRHITQGALEIEGIKYENGTLTFTSALVENDPYTVTLHLPDGYSFKSQEGFDTVEENDEVVRLTVIPKGNGEKAFIITIKDKA